MAIDNIIKRKIGEQIRDWIYLGIRTGARLLCTDGTRRFELTNIVIKQEK